MEWGILVPVAAIVIGPLVWLGNNWVRARHGYPLHDADEEEIKLLKERLEAMTASEDAMKGRIAVLEQIVTDKGFDTATQIEALRPRRIDA